MDQPRTKFQVAARFGAYYGLATIISMLLFYLLNFDMRSSVPSLVSYVLLVLFMFLGIKNHRDNDLNGYISYGSALGTGTLIAVCGGFLIAGWTIILFSFVDPTIVQKILESTQEDLLQRGMSESDVEMALESARKFMTPGWLFLFSLAGSAFMGLIFSLFVSIFLRKEANPFNSNQV